MSNRPTIYNPQSGQLLEIGSSQYKRLLRQGYIVIGDTLYKPAPIISVSRTPTIHEQTLRNIMNIVYEYTAPNGKILTGHVQQICNMIRYGTDWFVIYDDLGSTSLYHIIPSELDQILKTDIFTIGFNLNQDFNITQLNLDDDPDILRYNVRVSGDYNPYYTINNENLHDIPAHKKELQITFYIDKFIGG